MIKAIEIAENEVGYKTEGNVSKYFSYFFPKERPMPYCVPFIEWVFVMAYGKEAAKEKLNLDEFIQSVQAFVNYFKQAERWHWKQTGIGWLVFIRTKNENVNHVEIVVEATPDEITSIGGNVDGEVKKTTRRRDDFHIAGYGEIKYEEGELGL